MTGADAEEGHEQALVQGLCARGLLSRHALESALARPYDGYHRRIHEKAAALVHGIVSNHAYVDGNKRTALYLVELLAVRSGYQLVEEDLVLADVITDVARGAMDYPDLVTWFEARLVRS